MTKKSSLITFDQITRETNPHYYDYAIALKEVTKVLSDKLTQNLKLYNFTDELEFEDTIKYLLNKKDSNIEILATVFDLVTTTEVSYTDEGKYNITPSLLNNIIYFSEFEVAMVQLPIYQNHEDYEEEFIFAKDDHSLASFLNYMIEQQQQYMSEGVHIFTDTEDGLERSKEKITQQIHRDDVLLEDQLKTDIFRSIDEFFHKSGSFYTKYNIPYKRGILLYGSPGNGKTTLVKSIAGSVDAPVVYWQITEYTTSYSISEVFTLITKMAPMILVIEDIDSMPEESRSVFLNTLDGATTKEGIFLIGTTNYPEK